MEMKFSKLGMLLVVFMTYVKGKVLLKCTDESSCLKDFESYLNENVGRLIYQENIQIEYEKNEIHTTRGFGLIYEENKPNYIYDIYKVIY